MVTKSVLDEGDSGWEKGSRLDKMARALAVSGGPGAARAHAVAQFNEGHAKGHKDYRDGLSAGESYVEADHPSYHQGWARGILGLAHPGRGAV